MIKKKRAIIFLLVLMMTVGCRNKDLSCTKRIIDQEEVKVEENLSFSFKKEKLSNSTFSLQYSFMKNVDGNSESMKKSLEDQFAIYSGSKGVKYSFLNTDQGFQFTLKADIKKLTESEKSNLSNMVQYETYDEAKEKLIKEGYQCN